MGKKLKGGLAIVSVASDNPKQTKAFFDAVLGTEMVASLYDQEGYHHAISEDGIDLNVNVRHSPQETTVPYFEVDDITSAVNAAQAAGGNIIWGPQDVRLADADFDEYKAAVKEVDNVDVKDKSMGHAAIVGVPGGSQIGLIQVASHAEKHFKAGKQRSALSDYQDKVHMKSKAVAKKLGR